MKSYGGLTKGIYYVKSAYHVCVDVMINRLEMNGKWKSIGINYGTFVFLLRSNILCGGLGGVVFLIGRG
jgi:hypothetical protein